LDIKLNNYIKNFKIFVIKMNFDKIKTSEYQTKSFFQLFLIFMSNSLYLVLHFQDFLSSEKLLSTSNKNRKCLMPNRNYKIIVYKHSVNISCMIYLRVCFLVLSTLSKSGFA